MFLSQSFSSKKICAAIYFQISERVNGPISQGNFILLKPK